MIREYFRPQTLEAALALLARQERPPAPLGGGTALNQPDNPVEAVVDLQALGLDQLDVAGPELRIGATATLENLAHFPELPEALERAIRLEAPVNLRRAATIAGRLVSASGRSPFACAMLALDATLVWEPGQVEISLGDWLPLRAVRKPGSLIVAIRVHRPAQLAFETIGRSPQDLPIVCVAAARWRSGRTRVALGGFGSAPIVGFDGPESNGVEMACRDAYNAAGDVWASAEYRAEMAGLLAGRAAAALAGKGD